MKDSRRVTRWLGIALLLLSVPALAGIAQVRKQVEASMLVTGNVLIEPDGSVSQVQLDQPDKLPPGVRNLVDQAGKVWRFEPVTVDGVARKAKASMSLRVVAKELDSGDYSLELRGAYFGKEAMTAEDRQKFEGAAAVQSVSMRPPQFPEGAAMVGGRGVAYLILKIGADGRVQEAIVEQVNLQVVGQESSMKMLREQFGKSALRASKQWTFTVPTEGDLAGQPYWSVRVPVAYKMMGDKTAGYGEWEAYVPGPKQKATWAEDEAGAGDPDAMVAGGIYPVGQGLRLLTPLQSG